MNFDNTNRPYSTQRPRYKDQDQESEADEGKRYVVSLALREM